MRYRKLTTALVITGKGLHSPHGPVVKDSVLHLLSHHTEVRRFQEAPLRLGGSGALLVELKPEGS
jgi:DNA-nicking Smr family endonuclease